VTKWDRSYTHFTPLEVEYVGVGTKGLFESNPHLVDTVKASSATRAFLAGYISHLASDETWITQVYRPYFSNRDIFPNPVEANVWDRVLHLDLDRVAWEESGAMDGAIGSLPGSDQGVELEFIDADTLGQWRAWVYDFSRRPFNWGRLNFLAQRMYRDSEEAQIVVNSFLSEPQASLGKVYSKVPKKRIKEFRENAVAESVRLIKDHLDGH
jgi:hypothetical protein